MLAASCLKDLDKLQDPKAAFWQNCWDAPPSGKIGEESFESLMLEFCKRYKNPKDITQTKASHDGGVDIILDMGEYKIYVECKRTNHPISSNVVMRLRDAMGTEAKSGIIISFGGIQIYNNQNYKIIMT